THDPDLGHGQLPGRGRPVPAGREQRARVCLHADADHDHRHRRGDAVHPPAAVDPGQHQVLRAGTQVVRSGSGASRGQDRQLCRARTSHDCRPAGRDREEPVMSSFAQFGNDLYSGKRSIDFVGRQKLWYAVSVAMIVLAAIGLFGRHLNIGLEFRGGSEFTVSSVTDFTNFETRAKTAVGTLSTGSAVVVTRVGTDSVRIQTEKFQNNLTDQVKSALASEFKVGVNKITASTIGASWGATVSQKAITALIWFLVLVSLVLALYFRTWKMSVAALIALAHDIVITVGIYALAGFEVTPASVIGFLTIMGYSLYDTVVVFDKVRENTLAAIGNGRLSFSQAANQAVNQTLVRSINTSVVALLPVASI